MGDECGANAMLGVHAPTFHANHLGVMHHKSLAL